MARAGLHARSVLWVCLGTAPFAVGCDQAGEGDAEPISIGAAVGVSGESATVPQTPLAGTSIPRFVDPVPTFNGRRVDGTATVNVNMQEFQQKVLPASVYAGLPAPYNAGTYL